MSRIDLAEANYLGATASVAAGQKLLIPRMPSAPSRSLTRWRGRTRCSDDAQRRRACGVRGAAPIEEPTRLVHRVKSGETLYSIAKKYQTTVEALRLANSLRTSTLKVGARLVVQAVVPWRRSSSNHPQKTRRHRKRARMRPGLSLFCAISVLRLLWSSVD